ncbi:PGRS repeat-containing protein, partial [Mycolicibacterium conceptionense]
MTADVRLVNTEGPSSDSGSDTGNPPGASENTSTPGTKPKADKPRLPSLKQVQDRLSERATEATKHLNDFTRNGVQRAIDNAKANGDKETRSPQRRHKSPAAPKTDSTDKAEAPDTSTASESQQNTTPGHRLREIADRVTEALPRPSGDKPQNTPPAESLLAGPSAGSSQRPTAFAAPTPAPAPSSPINPITGLLSAVTLGTFLAPNAPTEPADMPAVWAVMAWARRQSAYTTTNNTAANRNALVAPTLTAAPVTPGVPDPTELVYQFIYQPLHEGTQLWITSPLGGAVNGVINQVSGQYLIGNGTDGTLENPDGTDGGLWFGDGGDGFDGAADGVAGGDGGDAGWFGDGGQGGAGWAGLDGGDGGQGGSFMGTGGRGGAGGASSNGQAAGSGGNGGDADGWFFGIAGNGGQGGIGLTGTAGRDGDWAANYGNGFGNGEDGGVGGGNGGDGGQGGTANGWFFANGGDGGQGGTAGTGGVGGRGADGDAAHLNGGTGGTGGTGGGTGGVGG